MPESVVKTPQDTQNLFIAQVKNTFIDFVKPVAEELPAGVLDCLEDNVPLSRTVSDQTHNRTGNTIRVPFLPSIAPISELESTKGDIFDEVELGGDGEFSTGLTSTKTSNAPQIMAPHLFLHNQQRFTFSPNSSSPSPDFFIPQSPLSLKEQGGGLLGAYPGVAPLSWKGSDAASRLLNEASRCIQAAARISEASMISMANEDHYWHPESIVMGPVEENGRVFTKTCYEGRLSLVTNDKVFDSGVHRFVVYIESGEPSIADGMGILFNSLLPCKKNIPKLNSIFINRKGQLCSRINSDTVRRLAMVAPLESGRAVDIVIDIDNMMLVVAVFSFPNGVAYCEGQGVVDISTLDPPSSTCHFGIVLKNLGVRVRFLKPMDPLYRSIETVRLFSDGSNTGNSNNDQAQF